MAAPEVKPTTTECETKLTRVPSLANPNASWYTPAKKVSVRTSWRYCPDPGSAMGLIELNTTMEMAVVGPDIKCREDPKSAATTGVTMAVYKPYSGGRPAIMAKATPWGRTITAPVSPARRSAFKVLTPMNCHQRKNGNSFRHRELVLLE